MNWKFHFHDIKILGVQVDLLMRTPQGLLSVVEVKTEQMSGMARLGRSQRSRLLRVCGVLASHEPVEMWFAIKQGQKLTLLPVDSLTDD